MKDEYKTKEQLIEELVQLRQQICVLEHDIRNVLIPVVGYSDFLLVSPEKLNNKEIVMECLQQIKKAAEVGWEIIRSL